MDGLRHLFGNRNMLAGRLGRARTEGKIFHSSGPTNVLSTLQRQMPPVLVDLVIVMNRDHPKRIVEVAHSFAKLTQHTRKVIIFAKLGLRGFNQQFFQFMLLQFKRGRVFMLKIFAQFDPFLDQCSQYGHTFALVMY